MSEKKFTASDLKQMADAEEKRNRKNARRLELKARGAYVY